MQLDIYTFSHYFQVHLCNVKVVHLFRQCLFTFVNLMLIEIMTMLKNQISNRCIIEKLYLLTIFWVNLGNLMVVLSKIQLSDKDRYNILTKCKSFHDLSLSKSHPFIFLTDKSVNSSKIFKNILAKARNSHKWAIAMFCEKYATDRFHGIGF